MEEAKQKSSDNSSNPQKKDDKEGGSATKLKGNTKHIGQFARMSSEKVRAIAQKGGLAPKKPRAPNYSKCINCELKDTCERAFEEAYEFHKKAREVEETGENPLNINVEKNKNWPLDQARCVYEIENRQGYKMGKMREFQAFVSGDPRALLNKIQLIFDKLEGQVNNSPSFAKYAQLFYMLTNLYKLKFGDKGASVNITNVLGNNSGNTTLDVQTIMQEIRAEKKRVEVNVVDGDYEEKQDEVKE